MNEWIQIEKAHPYDNVKVLLLLNDGNLTVGYKCIDEEWDEATYTSTIYPIWVDSFSDSEFEFEDVTHWMPLPPPPKEDSE